MSFQEYDLSDAKISKTNPKCAPANLALENYNYDE